MIGLRDFPALGAGYTLLSRARRLLLYLLYMFLGRVLTSLLHYLQTQWLRFSLIGFSFGK